MALPSVGGGYQIGDGNLNEPEIVTVPVPATATDSATLTSAQLTNGIIIGTPTTTAAYTLPLASDLDAYLNNSKVGSAFDFRVINTTTAGVITMTTNTGWTIGSSGSQGLMTIAATAGTVRSFRARRLGDNSWALYAIS
jgi:hypothetical protein|tara:strand:- start:2751 stop:3167 length:417 start_codon:yes stop_codon:yes gene_type:complete